MKLLVLAPVSEYKGERIAKVIRAIRLKNAELDVVTSRDIWLATMPHKPAYVSWSQWRGEGTGFYINWSAAYRRKLSQFSDVLVIPRSDGSVGNGTRVDLKSVKNANINVLLDDRLVPISRTSKKQDRDSRTHNVFFSRVPELSRV